MADDTSNLINVDRLGTFDTNLKNYINTNSQASELLDEVVLLIEDNIQSGKAVIAQSVTNKGVPTTSDQGFSEIAANIDSIRTGSGNATAANVLAGKTFTNDDGPYTGTMPNNGSLGTTLNCGGSYTIPAGYTTGGTVTANSLASQTSSATATAAQILKGKTAYVNGSLVTGSIESKAAATYTPTTTAQTIASGQYLSGAQTIAGDANLVSANIKSGVTIFGVSGNANVVNTSSGTATAAQILSGQKAWVDGKEITGTMLDRNTAGTNDAVGMSTQYSTVAGNPTTSNLQMTTMTDNVSRISVQPPAGYYNGGSYVSIPTSSFGTATAAQVLSGKTFTSTAGLKVSGTIASKAAATYTPGTSNQTISAGQYLSGAQTIAGSSNLVASNIKSGVKIFNVTGSMKDASSLKGLSFESRTFTVSGQKTVTNPTSGTAVLMGTITLPSVPFCIYLPGHWSSARTSDDLYTFTGCGLDHGYTSNTSHVLGGYTYSGSHAKGVAYFPALDATAQYESYHEGVAMVTGDTVSKFTTQSTTPFTWKSGQFSTSSSSIQYVLARWYLYFSSDLKTGYIYGVPVQFTYGAYGEYSAGAKSMTSPTSITFGNIAFC